MQSQLLVEKVGAHTSVGTTAAETMASISVRLQRFVTVRRVRFGGLPHEVLNLDETLPVGAPSPLLDVIPDDDERMATMAAEALRQAALGAQNPWEPAVVILCCPDGADGAEDVAAAPKCHDRWFPAAVEMAGVRSDLNASKCFAHGRAAITTAVSHAAALLRGGRIKHCYIGACESLLRPLRLRPLLQSRRVLSETNPNGFVPGEGSVFLRLGWGPPAAGIPWVAGFSNGLPDRMMSVPGKAASNATGNGSLESTDRVLEAAALAAIAQAGLCATDVGMMCSDVSGERRFVKELALALTRIQSPQGAGWTQVRPAMCVGELGAVAGPLGLGYLALAAQRNASANPVGLHLAMADGGARGALIVRASDVPPATGPQRTTLPNTSPRGR